MRLITWAERNKPQNWRRIVIPLAGLGLARAYVYPFPATPGERKRRFSAGIRRSGPDPSIADTARLKAIGYDTVCSLRCAGRVIHAIPDGRSNARRSPRLRMVVAFGRALPVGLCAVLGAGAVLAATTQGPISAVVLMMELTGRDRSFILPLLLAASTATLVARSIERRSIYDARLTDEEIEGRQKLRESVSTAPAVVGESKT